MQAGWNKIQNDQRNGDALLQSAHVGLMISLWDGDSSIKALAIWAVVGCYNKYLVLCLGTAGEVTVE